MSLFDEVRVQDLCARLLDSQNGKGCPLESRHGRELKDLLQAVGGITPVGRGAPYALTDAGRTFLTEQLARAEHPEPNKGEQLQRLGVSLPARLMPSGMGTASIRDQHPLPRHSLRTCRSRKMR